MAEDCLRQGRVLSSQWVGPHHDLATGLEYFHCPADSISSWQHPSAQLTYLAMVADKLLQANTFQPESFQIGLKRARSNLTSNVTIPNGDEQELKDGEGSEQGSSRSTADNGREDSDDISIDDVDDFEPWSHRSSSPDVPASQARPVSRHGPRDAAWAVDRHAPVMFPAMPKSIEASCRPLTRHGSLKPLNSPQPPSSLPRPQSKAPPMLSEFALRTLH